MIWKLTRALLEDIVARARDDVFTANADARVLEMTLRAPAFMSGVYVARGEALVAAGLWPLWHGRAQAWMLVTRQARPRDIVAAVRECRDWMDGLQSTWPEAHRIEMWCCADAPWADSFARALGMTREGLARCWGPDGSDHALYARVAR